MTRLPAANADADFVALPSPTPPAPMFRLSLLMFLQFFIWGSWYLSVSLYMLAHGMGEGRFYAYTAGPLAAIIAPFITGLIADRFFNTERVLSVLFLGAGGFMLSLPFIARTQGSTLFNAVILAHMLCYMPTLALTASLSFTHLPAGGERFPLVRLWGTIGWIVAGFALAFLFTVKLPDGSTLKGETRDAQFWLGGGAAIVLAFYCLLALPKTPAPKRGQPVNLRDLFFVDAWRQLRSLSFTVFIFGSFLVCIPLAAYYASLQQQMDAMGMKYITAWKNTGTFFEAGLMFLLPWFFRRFGVKWVIVVGIASWAIRYALFALGASPEGWILVIAGIALHGLCYDFFFVAGQVYVDRVTPASIRGQAQGMNIFFTQGLGLYFGALVTQELSRRAFGDVPSNAPESLPLWPKLWWPLCGMAAVIMIAFILLFREDRETRGEESSDERELAQAEANLEAPP